jgi:hypothetical protein
MFLQMACIIPADEMATRKIIGLIASCLAISIGLFCVIYFDYVKQIAANDYIEHDVKTVTAGDYSVEFKIDADFFDQWDIYHKLNWISRQRTTNNKTYTSSVEAFRDWL